MLSNERSAEWLRGAIAALDEWGYSYSDSMEQGKREYQALLAAAEAREGGENKSLRQGLLAITAAYRGDATGCNPQLLLDAITALLREAPAREAAQPTAAEVIDARDYLGEARLAAIDLANKLAQQRIAEAEVIAACRVALDGIDRIARCVHLDMGGKHKYHIQHVGQHEAIEEVKRALALCARWKEANGGPA